MKKKSAESWSAHIKALQQDTALHALAHTLHIQLVPLQRCTGALMHLSPTAEQPLMPSNMLPAVPDNRISPK